MSDARNPNAAAHPQTRDRAAHFGAAVRFHRHRMGLSQEKLAEVVGVDRQSINRWENAAYSPSLHQLFKLADGLQVKLSTLLALAETGAEETRRQQGSGAA